MHEIASWYCPSLCDLAQWCRACRWEIQKVGCAHGKVGEDFEIAHAVGSKLKVCDFGGILGWSALERRQVGCLDGFGETDIRGIAVGAR